MRLRKATLMILLSSNQILNQLEVDLVLKKKKILNIVIMIQTRSIFSKEYCNLARVEVDLANLSLILPVATTIVEREFSLFSNEYVKKSFT
jgi:hypothetical protein